MTVEFKRNIEKWITDLKDEVASLKEQEQKYATCMDELVEEGMAKARAKADADRAKCVSGASVLAAEATSTLAFVARLSIFLHAFESTQDMACATLSD